MGDEVTGFDPGLIGGRVVDGRDDFHKAFFLRDFDTKPAEFPARLHAHVGSIIRRQEGRVRVERSQHAVDRSFDQISLVDLFDILGADPLEYVAK